MCVQPPPASSLSSALPSHPHMLHHRLYFSLRTLVFLNFLLVYRIILFILLFVSAGRMQKKACLKKKISQHRVHTDKSGLQRHTHIPLYKGTRIINTHTHTYKHIQPMELKPEGRDLKTAGHCTTARQGIKREPWRRYLRGLLTLKTSPVTALTAF